VETCVATPVATAGKACRVSSEFLVLVAQFGFQQWGKYIKLKLKKCIILPQKINKKHFPARKKICSAVILVGLAS